MSPVTWASAVHAIPPDLGDLGNRDRTRGRPHRGRGRVPLRRSSERADGYGACLALASRTCGQPPRRCLAVCLPMDGVLLRECEQEAARGEPASGTTWARIRTRRHGVDLGNILRRADCALARLCCLAANLSGKCCLCPRFGDGGGRGHRRCRWRRILVSKRIAIPASAAGSRRRTRRVRALSCGLSRYSELRARRRTLARRNAGSRRRARRRRRGSSANGARRAAAKREALSALRDQRDLLVALGRGSYDRLLPTSALNSLNDGDAYLPATNAECRSLRTTAAARPTTKQRFSLNGSCVQQPFNLA
jgi:hypothetical protein